MKRFNKIRLIEFLAIGIVMGTIEDLIAVSVATDETIDLRVLLIVVAVAIPFAFISEIVVDNPRFWAKLIPDKLEERFRDGKN